MSKIHQTLQLNIYYDALKDIKDLDELLNDDNVFLSSSEHYHDKHSLDEILSLTLCDLIGDRELTLQFNVLDDKRFRLIVGGDFSGQTNPILYNDDAESDLSEFVSTLYENKRIKGRCALDEIESNALESLKSSFDHYKYLQNIKNNNLKK